MIVDNIIHPKLELNDIIEILKFNISDTPEHCKKSHQNVFSVETQETILKALLSKEDIHG